MLTLLYPRGMNWFYSHQADLLAHEFQPSIESVKAVAADDISELSDRHGTIILFSAWECLESAKIYGRRDALEAILTKQFRRRVLLNYDSLYSHYFSRHFLQCEDVVTEIVDVTMVRQTSLATVFGVPYTWIPEAFTRSEAVSIQTWSAGRPIPWAMLGHVNSNRVALASVCVEFLGKGGFLFLPPIRPYKAESGLDQIGINKVLRKTNLYVWGSHHGAPYHEGLRAMHAIAAGAIPAKIDPIHSHVFSDVPWVYGSVRNLAARLNDVGFDALYDEAKRYILAQGSIGDLILRALDLSINTPKPQGEK